MRWGIAVAALVLAGCEATAGVRGQMEDGSETFTGKATGYLDGSGVLSISSNRGTVCDGQFVYTSGRTGAGTFVCRDGRSGPFSFVSTGSRGTGRGTIGGKQFTFTFG